MFEDIEKCPTCGQETHVGFGLAGGGYGSYVYCDDCGIISKTQETEAVASPQS
jgi:transcription elongation factor Elf1